MIWGEGGVAAALEGSAGPSAAYRALSGAFAVRPIDALEALDGERLLLVAQPRPPGPRGLVTLDGWVRRGGRALILADPALRWPSAYPLGDPRRPPAIDGLDPLLLHWGLRRIPPPIMAPPLVRRDMWVGGARYRIEMATPGRFVTLSGACRVAEAGLIVECRIGMGRAILLADADLLRDPLWVGPGAAGAGRVFRTADNVTAVVAMLDRLREARATGDLIHWMEHPESFRIGVIAAFSVPLSILSLGLALMVGRSRRAAKKVSDRLIHRKGA